MKRTRLIGLALTIVFLALVFWRIDFREFGAALATANYWYVVPAACCTLLGYLVRTARWEVLLRPAKRIPFSSLFPVLMIGFASNNVLPARIGEVVRAYTLGSRESVSKSLGLATIVLERMFDGITLVLFVVVLSLLVRLPEWGAQSAYLSAVVFAVAFFGVLFLLMKRDFALRVISAVLRPLPDRVAARGQNFASFFIVGLDAVKGARSVLATLGLSVVVWCLEALSYILILRGFDTGLVPEQGVFAAVFMLVVVNLGIMLPSAPGYVGTFQFFGVLALGAFGVSREIALSTAVVSHAMQYVLVTAIGFVCMWVQNLSFGQIVQEERS